VALVDIGHGTTDVAIFSEDSIKHTAVLALGGANLTNDIAYGLRTPMVSAEKLKIRHGCAMAELVGSEDIIEVPSVGGREPRKLSRQVLADICEPRVEEILTLVDQELIRAGYKNLVGAGIVLTGGTSLIHGIAELGEQIFNLPTRVGYPMSVGGLQDVVASPMYATAVGLLQYGADKEGAGQSFRIRDENVFNRILSRMRKWFSDIT
jgi:cell division protein FtsA